MALEDQPLGMTVHSLPSVQQAVRVDAERTISGRWKMLAVLLVCAAPVIASYFTYYVVRPDSQRSFGELIEPQQPLPDVQATDAQGRTVPLRSLQGQWLLVAVAGGACDAVCESNLYLQRQLREGLGKEKERVDRVWLLTDDAPVRPALLPGLAGATVLRLPADAVAAWLRPATAQTLGDHLYVVDPQGHWMLRFPPRLDVQGAAKAKRDLVRLLRASVSWDPPGRTR